MLDAEWFLVTMKLHILAVRTSHVLFPVPLTKAVCLVYRLANSQQGGHKEKVILTAWYIGSTDITVA